MMEHPGRVYKKMRIAKGYSVREAAGAVVTPQFLNKFEREASDIRFSTLLALLERINVTVAEFGFQMEETLDHWLYQFEYQLDNSYTTGNSQALQQLISENEAAYQETGEIRYQIAEIIAKCYYNASLADVYSYDQTVVSNFLRETESWGRFELFVISYLSRLFSREESVLYARQILKNIDQDWETNRWRYDAYLHLMAHLVGLDELVAAEKLWQAYEKEFTADRNLTYLHQDLYGRFVQGLLLMAQGEPAGASQCERIIKTFGEDSGYPAYANRMHVMYQSFKNTVAQRRGDEV